MAFAQNLFELHELTPRHALKPAGPRPSACNNEPTTKRLQAGTPLGIAKRGRSGGIHRQASLVDVVCSSKQRRPRCWNISTC